MKKVISLLLSIVMVLSLATVCVYAAEPTATLSSDAAGTTLKEGDTFVVDVVVPNPSNFNSLMVGIVFDNTLFEVTKVNNGNLGYMDYEDEDYFDSMGTYKKTWSPTKSSVDQANTSGKATWTRACVGAGNIEMTGGKAGSITFKVKAVAADTSYTFGIMEDNDLTGYLAIDAANAPKSGVTVNLDDGITAPVVDETIEVDATAADDAVNGTKTWGVTVGADLLAAGVKAILTNSHADVVADNTQEVALTFGEIDKNSQMQCEFDVIVKLQDYAKYANNISLAIEKAAN